MAVRFQFRRGTAAEWTATNPTLAEGEMGIETDTDQFKLGDGTTAWTSLAYGGVVGPAGVDGVDGVDGVNGVNGVPGANGADGAGYDFPQRVPEPGDPPLPPPFDMYDPPNPPETIDMYQYPYSVYGIVGAYKVGDLIKYFNINTPENYLLGRIISLDNVGAVDEGLTFLITDYKNSLPSVFDVNDQVLSLIGAEGPGYSFRQAVPAPLETPDDPPTPPDYWEDLVSGTSVLEIRGIAGAFKVEDYVQVTNPWYNPGAFIKGYITSINNYGLNDFIQITIDSWDSAEAPAETSFDVTPGYVKLSIAGEAGADGAQGDPLILQSLYSRPDIQLGTYFSPGYNAWGSSQFDSYTGLVSLGTITKQEASSIVLIDFPVVVDSTIAYQIT
jgi:hypothetical protein